MFLRSARGDTNINKFVFYTFLIDILGGCTVFFKKVRNVAVPI